MAGTFAALPTAKAGAGTSADAQAYSSVYSLTATDAALPVKIGGTTTTIGAAVVAFESQDAATQQQMEQTLISSGFLKPTAAADPVSVTDAYIAALRTAHYSKSQDLGTTIQDWENATSGSNSVTATIDLTNPTDVAYAANTVAQQLIGRKLSSQEIAGISSALQAQELSQGTDKALAQISQVTGGAVGSRNPSGATSGPGQIPPAQVYAEALRQGGTAQQAQVAAALVSGVESDGSPTELAGGVGPAAGLFQFEPGTWKSNGGGTYASVAQNASWQQQVAVFLNATKGNHFGAWGPDVVAARGNPNSTSNPAYGYAGPVQPGSVVGNVIAKNAASWGAGTTAPAQDTTGTTAPSVGSDLVAGQAGSTQVAPGASILTTVDPTTVNAETDAYLSNNAAPEYQGHELLGVFQAIADKVANDIARQPKALSGPVKVT